MEICQAVYLGGELWRRERGSVPPPPRSKGRTYGGEGAVDLVLEVVLATSDVVLELT